MANYFSQLAQKLNPFSKQVQTAGPAGFGAARGSVLETVYPVQVHRVRQDVGRWRDALDRAENVYYPDRVQLLNIYADAVLDAHLSSVLETRKINVLSQPFQLVDAVGKENPKLTRLLKRPWFRQFCRFALEHIDYGHSLIEFAPPVGGEFHKVSLINRQYVFPEAGLVRTMPGMITGVDYRNDPQYTPWLLEVGDPHDLGLLLKAAPYAIWKKNIISAWADFTEIFGIPYRAVSGDMDGPQIAAAERMMAEMGQAGYGVFPGDNVKIDFMSPSTGNERIYDTFLGRINSELSKLVLGQTMTTDDGSSQSQANVHERVAASYTREDATTLAEIINEQLLPLLVRHGYALNGYEFRWDDTESLSKEKQFTIVQGIMQNSGYKVSRKYLTDTFGVELEQEAPAAGTDADGKPVGATAEARPILGYHIEEGVVSRNEARAQLNLPEVDESEAEKERVLTGKLSLVKSAVDVGIPLAQALTLVGLDGITVPPPPKPELPGKLQGQPTPTQPAPTASTTLSSLYASAGCCSGHAPVVLAAASEDKQLGKLADRLIKAVYAGDLFDGTIDGPLFAYLQEYLDGGIELGWDAPDPALRQNLRANVAKFSGFKTYEVQRAMTDKLYDEAGKIRPFADFREDALQVHQLYNVDYLRTEYNHAVASAQMASKWARFEPGAMLRYDTVGDDRVRDEHRGYNKVTLSADDPWWETHYPPLDWNCRCSVTEVEPDATPVPAGGGIAEPAPLFRNNAGRSGEVFGKDHPYFDVSEGLAARITEQIRKADA